MARTFPDWIKAYESWSQDGFVPPQFNTWCAISTLCGALERKVWLPWSDTFSYYPNLYVMLVSSPGVGKSTALNKAVGLLLDLKVRNGTPNFIPSQVTEAKFIEMLGESIPFDHGNKVCMQSAGYFFASEASNSLRNVYGDFIACLTDFYDCPAFWEKATKKDDKITLTNVGLSLLAGSTFDYLGKLVTDDNIMGGFASRLTYVMQKEKVITNQKFQLGGSTDPGGARAGFRQALLADLDQIHKMVGPFTATPEFARVWEEWYPEFEKRRQEIKSEKMQSLLVRTNTTKLKLCMILSAAQSDDRVLRIEHWDRASELTESVEKDIPTIFRQAKAADTKSQSGMNNAMFLLFQLAPGNMLTVDSLKSELPLQGFTSHHVNSTIDMLVATGRLKVAKTVGSLQYVKFLGDPNQYF